MSVDDIIAEYRKGGKAGNTSINKADVIAIYDGNTKL